MKEREDLVRGNSKLTFRHVLKISDLNQRVNTTRLEMEEINSSLENLNSPSQKLLQLLFVSENPVVHFLVSENAIRVVTDRVTCSVVSLHISDDAFQLFETQVLVQDGVGFEVVSPGEALGDHDVGVGDAEVPGAEELEEYDVRLLVVFAEVDAPDGGGGDVV